MPRSQQEFRTHCFVADMLRRFGHPDVLWSHFPSGEKRSPITGARLKRMGLKVGWPDLIFIMPDGKAAFLELKAPGKQLSADQVTFKHGAWAAGCRYAVADTGQAAVEILRQWGILERVRIAA